MNKKIKYFDNEDGEVSNNDSDDERFDPNEAVLPPRDKVKNH